MIRCGAGSLRGSHTSRGVAAILVVLGATSCAGRSSLEDLAATRTGDAVSGDDTRSEASNDDTGTPGDVQEDSPPPIDVGCVPTTCMAAGANCGTLSDGCGSELSCGACTLPLTCGGAGKPNQCSCKPTTCAAVGASCGDVIDGCGGTVGCGACPVGQTCGATGPNGCGKGSCAPKTCRRLNAECGLVSDGCSKVLDCGKCGPKETCGSDHQCNG